MDQNFLNSLPDELKSIASELSDIILERALMRAYQNLSEENKIKMAQVFDSGTEEEKIEFLKNYLGDLQKIMIEEAKKAAEEIKK
ncbi:MAG: hypothetical protein ACP5RX_02485 [Minisyncoccia bacterium]